MKSSEQNESIIHALNYPSHGLINHVRRKLPSPDEIDTEDDRSIADLLAKVSEYLLRSPA